MDISLPLGPASNNYNMDVFVRITDNALAFVDYFIATAQSKPATTQQVNSLMASLSPPATTLTANPASASVTPSLTNNLVAKVVAEGNMESANTLYLSVNSILTQSVQNDIAGRWRLRQSFLNWTEKIKYCTINDAVFYCCVLFISAYPCINTTANFTNTMYTTNNIQLTYSSVSVSPVLLCKVPIFHSPFLLNASTCVMRV